MPRTSAIAAEQAEFAIVGPVLAPPPELTEEQRGFWRALVDPYPSERFRPECVPALCELVRAMSRSAKLNEELNAMRRWEINRKTKACDANRSIFLQLSTAAREEAKLINTLSQSLRLVDQSRVPKSLADAKREREPVGARPWAGADMPKPWDAN
jgi:hypothetical protein